MIAARPPRFQWGQRVRARVDLEDDGSHPAAAPGARLVEAGALGEIVRIGRHEGEGVPVYLVEFGGTLVVGCREEELDAA